MKLFVAIVAGLAICGSGWAASGAEVTIYTSVDEPYFAPLLKRFEKETGIVVRAVTDGEASKTAGLSERLLAERERPRADVYWGNEVFHTINLAEQNCFAVFEPVAAKGVPARYRDSGGRWTGIGLRARVLVTGEENKTPVRSVKDLARPELKGKVAMANPAFGTTSGHMAALYLKLGKEDFAAWVRGLKANNVKLLGGNSAVVTQVAAGNFAAGLTDNDDVAAAQTEGQKVSAAAPDQEGDSAMGTLLIPTTIALVAKAPHEAEGKRLIEFLCDPAVEAELLRAKFLAYSVRQVGSAKPLEVDYAACAKVMKEAVELTLSVLQER